MSEYIKREDVIDLLEQVLNAEEFFDTDNAKAQSDLALWFEERILELPSTDVVEVVRCKDCKHHEELLNNNDGNVICWVHDIDVIVDRNGYCNYGERKEQEHDK